MRSILRGMLMEAFKDPVGSLRERLELEAEIVTVDYPDLDPVELVERALYLYRDSI